MRVGGATGPVRVVEAAVAEDCVPGCPVAAAEIYSLAGHEIGADDLRRGNVPRAVGADDRPLSAGLQLQLSQEGRLRSVHVGVACVPERAAVPAVGEDGPDGVGTGPEHAGDIKGLDLERAVVTRRARGELLVPHPHAVDEELVDAVGCGVGARLRGALRPA